MALLLSVALFLTGALVTAFGLRWQAGRRGSALPQLLVDERATWGR